MKIIVFDFDNTLTTYDTVYPFLLYANKDMLLFRVVKKSLFFLCRILYKYKVISNFQLKDLGIKLFIGGYTKESVELAAKRFFKRIQFHEKVYQELERYSEEGSSEVFLSTASFWEYVVEVKIRFPELNIQASSIVYDKENVKGLEFNNYGDNKTEGFNGTSIDILYTDSISDLALSKCAKEIRFVTKSGEVKKCRDLAHFIQCCRKS